MPVGTFLDALPAILFIAAHVMFLLVGVWVAKKAMDDQAHYAPALWLYVVSQIGFLAYFGGLFTLKMGVLLEQTLVLIMVLWIVVRRPAPRAPALARNPVRRAARIAAARARRRCR